MNRGVSIALIVVGVLLLIWGINAAESLSSDFSNFFTGSPTEKSIWLLIGGVAALVIGLIGTFRPARRVGQGS